MMTLTEEKRIRKEIRGLRQLASRVKNGLSYFRTKSKRLEQENQELKIADYQDELTLLNRYYIETRYPSD